MSLSKIYHERISKHILWVPSWYSWYLSLSRSKHYTWLDNSSTVRKLYHGISLANIVDHWACFISYYLTLSVLFSSPCKETLIFTSSLKAPLSNQLNGDLIMTVLCHSGPVSLPQVLLQWTMYHCQPEGLQEHRSATPSFLLVALEQLGLRIYIPEQVPRWCLGSPLRLRAPPATLCPLLFADFHS